MTLDSCASAARRAWRRALGALGLASFAFVGCTVFDGLTVPPSASARPGYLTVEDGARVCSLAMECPLLSEAIARSIGVPTSRASFSSCLGHVAGPLSPTRFGIAAQAGLLECVSASGSCAEALACAYVEPLAPSDPRCAGVVGDQCASVTMLVDCASGIAERCTSPYYGAGSECRLGLASEGRCGFSGCLPQSASPPRCTTGVYVRCDPATNLKVAKNCNTVGLTCPEGAEGADAQCATEDGIFPCDEPAATTCSPEGDRVRACDGALASEFDCAAMGGACVVESGEARCKRPLDQCSPRAPGIDVCAGNMISVCVGGAPRTLDCAALGLACIPGDSQTSGHCGF